MRPFLIQNSLVFFLLASVQLIQAQESSIPSIQENKIKKGDSMEINIGLKTENRKKMAQVLNNLLADEFLLYIKTINFHWNVKSGHFRDMHKFFLDQYEALLQIADDIAERIRSIDEPAFGTMQEFLKHTRLTEKPGSHLTDQQMIKSLLEDHEAIIRVLRKDQQTAMDLEDMGTNNFLLNLLEKQEKMAWMLRASLTK